MELPAVVIVGVDSLSSIYVEEGDAAAELEERSVSALRLLDNLEDFHKLVSGDCLRDIARVN